MYLMRKGNVALCLGEWTDVAFGLKIEQEQQDYFFKNVKCFVFFFSFAWESHGVDCVPYIFFFFLIGFSLHSLRWTLLLFQFVVENRDTYRGWGNWPIPSGNWLFEPRHSGARVCARPKNLLKAKLFISFSRVTRTTLLVTKVNDRVALKWHSKSMEIRSD